MKRKRAGIDQSATTPKKARADGFDDELGDGITVATPGATTPSERKAGKSDASGLASGKAIGHPNGLTNGRATPKSLRRVLFSTPTKTACEAPQDGTPTIVRNADRSARRKSARRLIERTTSGDHSDQEVSDEEDTLAQQIRDEEEDEGAGEDEAEIPDEDALAETPSKRGRGRPKGKRQKRPPTPPQNLPPHEQYFWHNRPGGTKTSNNTLASTSLLNHDEYFARIRAYADPHEPEQGFLLSLHARSFDQWLFELRNDFNLCLYGYGSKRALTQRFAEHVHDSASPPPKIVVANGYAPTLTIRDVLTTLAGALLPRSTALPAQPPALLRTLLSALAANPPHPKPLLILNSIDAPPLRRPATQALLAALAGSPHLSLLATADAPAFPLLWDQSQRAGLRLLFHDATTFAPLAAELDPVGAAAELLGRAGRRVAGRDGVAFVLRSLPENARALYRILVAEALAAAALDADADADADAGGRDEYAGAPIVDGLRTPAAAAVGGKRGRAAGGAPGARPDAGVEYRVLYRKAVEEFVCSSEHGFRTLLKEFHDHQMVESRRDALGAERLVLPFRREELDGLLEELVG